MSDFSKEYIERYKFDIPYDFSIIEEYNKLKEGYYVNIICEGYGFEGILKQNDTCLLLFTDMQNKLHKVLLFDLDKDTYLKYR